MLCPVLDEYIIPEPNSGCYLWVGGQIVSGYGIWGIGKTRVLVHRLVYEHEHGMIPNGLVVRHACDVPSCVNPKHLLLGTHADNANDKVSRGRQSKGDRHMWSKLTTLQVKQIREDYAAGISQNTIARQYGVTQSAVSRVVNSHNWR